MWLKNVWKYLSRCFWWEKIWKSKMISSTGLNFEVWNFGFSKTKININRDNALSAVSEIWKSDVYQVFTFSKQTEAFRLKGVVWGGCWINRFARYFAIFFSQKILFIHPRKKNIVWTKIDLVRENAHIVTSNRVLNAFKNVIISEKKCGVCDFFVNIPRCMSMLKSVYSIFNMICKEIM